MLERGSVVTPGGMQEQMAKEGQDVVLLCRLVLPGSNDGPICLRRSDHAWSDEYALCIIYGGTGIYIYWMVGLSEYRISSKNSAEFK